MGSVSEKHMQPSYIPASINKLVYVGRWRPWAREAPRVGFAYLGDLARSSNALQDILDIAHQHRRTQVVTVKPHQRLHTPRKSPLEVCISRDQTGRYTAKIGHFLIASTDLQATLMTMLLSAFKAEAGEKVGAKAAPGQGSPRVGVCLTAPSRRSARPGRSAG